MSTYRLHYLDAFTGKVVSRRHFDAADDEAAIAFAADVRNLAPMDLWLRNKKIKHWEAFPPTL